MKDSERENGAKIHFLEETRDLDHGNNLNFEVGGQIRLPDANHLFSNSIS